MHALKLRYLAREILKLVHISPISSYKYIYIYIWNLSRNSE